MATLIFQKCRNGTKYPHNLKSMNPFIVRFFILTGLCVLGSHSFVTQPFLSQKYIPPQSIGGGMMSQGGFVKVHQTYVAPQSIGGGMMSQGGVVETVLPTPSPFKQFIIDVATMTAAGHSSNNKFA